MTKSKTDKPKVARFSDHEVITPPHKLAHAVKPAIAGDDPVARAEAALAQLSSEFSGWMNDEFERLDRARHSIRTSGMQVRQREALFRAAHDIKGQAATLGFPLVADIAASLCRLIEDTVNPRQIPLVLIDQHVDAVRAVMREHAHPLADTVAAELTSRLREVTDEFLRREGKDANVTSPPLAPER
jgi:chemotaxis protein histidine kinase CheA